MDNETKKRWDSAAGWFDLTAVHGPERRWGPTKIELFSAMHGKILFLAMGTGLDIRCFPPHQDIIGIDISPKMLEKARQKAKSYSGKLELKVMDVHEMDFAPGSFDQVFTSCTFCSVPNPVHGLEAIRTVLKPGGELRMFEHTGSRYFPFNLMLHFMNPLCKRVGPEVNRDTVANVRKAGFVIKEVKPVFLDVIKTIMAVAPDS